MITIYVCENSAARALDRIRDQVKFPVGTRLLEVPCLGSLKKSDLLEGLQVKGGRVLVIGCHAENCKFVYGNKRACRRVAALKADMAALDIGPERLQCAHIAAVEDARLVQLLAEFIKETK